MLVAGFLGYSLEPQFRERLTGNIPEQSKPQEAKKEAKKKPVEEPTKKVMDEPKVVTPLAPEPPVVEDLPDPAKFPADMLPEKILLKADAEISDAASGLNMTVTAGNKVNLVRLEGMNVVISPGAGPFEGTVPVKDTDLQEQLAAMPEPDASAEEKKMPEPEPDPEPKPEPAPKPAPAPAPAEPLDTVSVMKASIKAGEIKEFAYDQVLEWKESDESEAVEGTEYEVGMASYKAETVFGVKTIQAKALIKDGKVVRWLWPKSGMEIK